MAQMLILLLIKFFLGISYQIAIIGPNSPFLANTIQYIWNISSLSRVDVFPDLPTIIFQVIDDVNLIIDSTSNQISRSSLSSYENSSNILLIILDLGTSSSTTFYSEHSLNYQLVKSRIGSKLLQHLEAWTYMELQ